jgi:hypothetical protein
MFLIENYTCIFTNCDSAVQCIVFSYNDDINKLALLKADWPLMASIWDNTTMIIGIFTKYKKKTPIRRVNVVQQYFKLDLRKSAKLYLNIFK